LKKVHQGQDNNPWTIMYRIVMNKLKTGNVMSTIKNADGSILALQTGRKLRTINTPLDLQVAIKVMKIQQGTDASR